MTVDRVGLALELAREAGLLPDDWLPAADPGGPASGLLLGGVPVRVVGLGWAAVDLDRAFAELDRPIHPATVLEVRDELLGARGREIGGTPPDGTRLVALEPSTEGRLAGSLAHRGEGPAALYLAPSDGALSATVERLTRRGVRTRNGSTALGPGVLVVGGSPAGPQILLVAVPSGS